MHIVLLNDDLLPEARGGSAAIVEWLRQGLTQRGHRVTLITTSQDPIRGKEQDLSDGRGSIISIHVEYPLRERHWKCLRIPEVSQKLTDLLDELHPDVVHAHVIHTYLTYDALRIARKFTEKIFLTAHDTFLASFHRVNGARYIRDALAGRPHRMRLWGHLRAAGRRYNPQRNSAIRRILRETGTNVICVSHALELFLRTHGIERTTVIWNAVPPMEPPPPTLVETFRKQHRLTGPTILFGGRISEDKGIDVLLSAMERVLLGRPNAGLLLTGDRDRLTAHLSKAAPAVQHAVRVTGWIPTGDMPLAYSASDVVTTPSIYLDAFNIMNLEAMAFGKPVVGTCFGGTPEIVLDGVTGHIRNPIDTGVFAEAIIDLLQNPEIAQKMGEEGRRRAREEFSLDRFTEKHLALYREGLAPGTGAL
jgi:glycosyltransferase involved in cell wall biosynthesis